MLNKELLMMGSAEGLWTLQCVLDGDLYISLTLKDINENILWQGNPDFIPIELKVPPNSTLRLSWDIGVYNIESSTGVSVEDIGTRELELTVLQNDAYLEAIFRG
ncbi:MAG: hypothetical protein BHW61_00300 [Sutterella sp. 63_29]|nr:MAG: hypothetical protein BHW61_00300 [Sutterella sp. 63_29]